MANSILEAAQTAYEGFGKGDLNPLFSILADDIVWNSHSHPSSPFHGIHKGIPAVQSYFGNMVKVDLEKFDVRSMIEANDQVIVIINVRRTLKESGQVTEGQFVHVWTFADGKIKEGNLYEASAHLD